MAKDKELESFKREINLTEYMAANGYMLNWRESSTNSAVMTNRDDKLIVAKGTTGFWIYFSVRDDSDNGTIIDFCQNRTGKSFGEIKKELRPWLDVSKPSKLKQNQYKLDLKPVNKNREQVLKKLAKTSVITNHPYLESRGIKESTLNNSRFEASVRLDNYGNAVFPHQDESGITGFEIKNHGFTGFSKGGEKALWCSNSFKSDNNLVITESAIDALSYAQLHPETINSSRFISVGGAMSEKQRRLIKVAMEKIAANNTQNQISTEIIIATDNDEAGENLAKELEELAPQNKTTVTRALPTAGKDWNDTLTTAIPTL